jgi:large subunit ribosomal protein L4
MREALLYTADAKKKGGYALPAEFDGKVSQGALYHAVRQYLGNQRQGTHSTKTRGEVSGGNQKPWRQKGTGRARQGSTRAPHWPGGGIVFGPRPRDYRTDLPRKVRQLARRSALNERANGGAIHVLEQFEFAEPKTKHMVELLDRLGLAGREVLVLTAEHSPNVHLSGRNIPGVMVMRYRDAAAYDILRADALVVEEAAIGGHAVAGKTSQRAKRATRGATPTAAAARGRSAARARSKAKQPAAKKAAPAPKKGAGKKKKGGSDA